MTRHLATWIVVLLAVIMLHDGWMAVEGHAVAPAHDHHDDHVPDEVTLVPEDCGTVRLVLQRMSPPEPPVRDSALLPVPALPTFAAISEPFLVVPVVPPPSACLARFQVFRI